MIVREKIFEGAFPTPPPKKLKEVSQKYYEELSKIVDFKITPYYDSFNETWERTGVGRNTFAKWQISKDFFVIFSFNTAGKYIASLFNVVSESKKKPNLYWYRKYLEEILKDHYYKKGGKGDNSFWVETYKNRLFEIRPIKETLPAEQDAEVMLKKIRGIVQRYEVDSNSTVKEYVKSGQSSLKKEIKKMK